MYFRITFMRLCILQSFPWPHISKVCIIHLKLKTWFIVHWVHQLWGWILCLFDQWHTEECLCNLFQAILQFSLAKLVMRKWHASPSKLQSKLFPNLKHIRSSAWWINVLQHHRFMNATVRSILFSPSYQETIPWKKTLSWNALL